MSSNDFIKVAEKFVCRNPSRYKTYYKSEYDRDTIDYEGNQCVLVFESKLAILQTAAQTTPLGIIDIYADIQKNHESDTAYAGLARLTNTLEKFKSVNDIHNLADKVAVDALLTDVQNLHQKRLDMFSQYGDYGLQTERGTLTPEDITKVNNVFTNLETYQEFLAISKKEVRKFKNKFDSLITPFLFEKLSISSNRGSYYYGSASKLKENKNYVYYPAKGFSPLFPGNLILASQLLLTEFGALKAKGENLLESLDSVEKRNAKKDLQGYAIYVNHDRYEGFLTSEANITKNILEAKIFETPTQGRAWASRRSYKDCMIVEISFHFSKILEATNCAMGPSMQTLVATREADDISELLPPAPAQTETPAPKKKHKI